MSADNAIVIGKFDDGYRVREVFAMDNLTYYKDHEIDPDKHKAMALATFHSVPHFIDLPSASRESERIQKEFDAKGYYTEYGVIIIDVGIPFPKDMTLEKANELLDHK